MTVTREEFDALAASIGEWQARVERANAAARIDDMQTIERSNWDRARYCARADMIGKLLAVDRITPIHLLAELTDRALAALEPRKNA